MHRVLRLDKVDRDVMFLHEREKVWEVGGAGDGAADAEVRVDALEGGGAGLVELVVDLVIDRLVLGIEPPDCRSRRVRAQ